MDNPVMNSSQTEGRDIVPGVIFVEPGSRNSAQSVRLGTASECTYVPLSNDNGAYPQVNSIERRVLSAAVRTVGVGLMGRPKEYRSGILRCPARDLRFGFGEYIAEPLSTCWVGIFGAKLHASHGHPKNTMVYDQIVNPTAGQRLIGVDSSRDVGIATWDGNRYSGWVPATLDDLAAYIIAYGMGVKLSKSIRWAWNSLEELREANKASAVDLQAKSTGLAKRFRERCGHVRVT